MILSNVLTVTVLSLIIFVVLDYLRFRFFVHKELRGMYGYPFVGCTINYLRNYGVSLRSTLKCGAVSKMRMFGYTVIHISDKALIEYVLKRESRGVKSSYPVLFDRIFGKYSVFTLRGDRHKNMRNKMMPTLRIEDTDYENFVRVVNSTFMKNFCRTVELYDFTSDMAIALLLTFINKKPTNSDDTIKGLLHRVSDGIANLPTPECVDSAYSRGIRASDEIYQYVKDNYDVERFGPCAEYESGVRDNVFTLMFAGYETMASTICNLLYVIAVRTDIRDKLVEEQRRVIAKHGTSYSKEVYDSCTYFDSVFGSVTKAIPVLTGAFREATDDLVLPGYDVTVKKGEKMLLSMMGSSYLQEPDDLRLSPDERIEKLIDPEKEPKNKPLVFGGGCRLCLGKGYAMPALKTVVFELLRRYDMELMSRVNDYDYIPVVKPKNKVYCVFTKKK